MMSRCRGITRIAKIENTPGDGLKTRPPQYKAERAWGKGEVACYDLKDHSARGN
jgi:hypothetical protein